MRIGELAGVTGVSTKALRFYETEGLVPEPARTPNGYRDYDDATADRVAFIKHAQTAGLTLRQIRDVLAIRDDGRPPCTHVSEFVDDRLADIDQRLRELRDTRRRLLDLRQRLDALNPTDCAPDSICAAIPHT